MYDSAPSLAPTPMPVPFPTFRLLLRLSRRPPCRNRRPRSIRVTRPPTQRRRVRRSRRRTFRLLLCRRSLPACRRRARRRVHRRRLPLQDPPDGRPVRRLGGRDVSPGRHFRHCRNRRDVGHAERRQYGHAIRLPARRRARPRVHVVHHSGVLPLIADGAAGDNECTGGYLGGSSGTSDATACYDSCEAEYGDDFLFFVYTTATGMCGCRDQCPLTNEPEDDDPTYLVYERTCFGDDDTGGDASCVGRDRHKWRLALRVRERRRRRRHDVRGDRGRGVLEHAVAANAHACAVTHGQSDCHPDEGESVDHANVGTDDVVTAYERAYKRSKSCSVATRALRALRRSCARARAVSWSVGLARGVTHGQSDCHPDEGESVRERVGTARCRHRLRTRLQAFQVLLRRHSLRALRRPCAWSRKPRLSARLRPSRQVSISAAARTLSRARIPPQAATRTRRARMLAWHSGQQPGAQLFQATRTSCACPWPCRLVGRRPCPSRHPRSIRAIRPPTRRRRVRRSADRRSDRCSVVDEAFRFADSPADRRSDRCSVVDEAFRFADSPADRRSDRCSVVDEAFRFSDSPVPDAAADGGVLRASRRRSRRRI